MTGFRAYLSQKWYVNHKLDTASYEIVSGIYKTMQRKILEVYKFTTGSIWSRVVEGDAEPSLNSLSYTPKKKKKKLNPYQTLIPLNG